MIKYLILFFIIISACDDIDSGNLTENKVIGKEIMIRYDKRDSVTQNEYLIIDNIKFIHIESFEKWGNDNFYADESKEYELISYLPTSVSVMNPINSSEDRKYLYWINSFRMNRILSNKLVLNNYEIVNKKLLSIKGELIIRNHDNVDIELQFSDNYPATILKLK